MASQIPWMNHAIWVHEKMTVVRERYKLVVVAKSSLSMCVWAVSLMRSMRVMSVITRSPFFPLYEGAWTIIGAVKRNANANI
jgi:hypothetical protein